MSEKELIEAAEAVAKSPMPRITEDLQELHRRALAVLEQVDGQGWVNANCGAEFNQQYNKVYKLHE